MYKEIYVSSFIHTIFNDNRIFYARVSGNLIIISNEICIYRFWIYSNYRISLQISIVLNTFCCACIIQYDVFVKYKRFLIMLFFAIR